jgi:N-acyl-D-amino-acid deacylase
MSLDLLLENARIVDGTGSPWFQGVVGIADGVIECVTRRRAHGLGADAVIDADQNVVAPGFIDTHSHSDLELFDDPTLAPKIRQGITTEVLGQDGFSMGPVSGETAQQAWQRQISSLDGSLDRAWDWETLNEYLEAVEDAGIAPNVASLVGHGAVRFEVMGMDDRPPTDAELDEMGELVTEALETGAIGFSTGLIYTPISYAETAEVAALAERLRPYSRPFVAHIRSEGRWIWDALDEFIDIGAAVDVPLHLSHFKVAGTKQHGTAARALKFLDAARARGVDITAEQYPYDAGSTRLSAVLPPWAHAGGDDEIRARLADPDVKERLRSAIEEWEIDGWENTAGLCGWENVYITSVADADAARFEGMSIAEIAATRDERPIDTVCYLLLVADFQVTMRTQMMAEPDVRTLMADPRVNICTDGLFGGKPHPRVYGTYPRVLETYVRAENHLRLEEAVRKMTALPARAMGLQSKGLIRPGMDADIVVFDPSAVGTTATYDSPRHYPTGISDVIVNGTLVVRNETVTGERPGEVLRA